MTPFWIATLVALLVTALAQASAPRGNQRVPHTLRSEPRRPVGMGLWIGLAVSTAVLALLQRSYPGSSGLAAGPPVILLPLAAAPLVLAGLVSDFQQPRSERHVLGICASGAGLFIAGLPIVLLLDMPLGPAFQLLATILWLFVVASIVELVSLAPLGIVLLGVALPGVVWASGGEQQTAASYLVAGTALGAVLGRAGADLAFGRRTPYGKGEIFALGFWLAAATSLAFLKSVAFAAFVLPLGILAVTAIILSIQAFERDLILRAAPGAKRAGE